MQPQIGWISLPDSWDGIVHSPYLGSMQVRQWLIMLNGSTGEDMECGVQNTTLVRHPNSERFHSILKELGDLHDLKQLDYGKDSDPFSNVRSSENWGMSPWVGAMVRATDKVHRLQSLVKKGKLNNESAEDSLRDLAVYAVIALVLFEEEHDRRSS